MDLRFGAESFLCICYKIAQDETNYISWQFDHGKRKGIEHFVKLISWGGFDDEGNRVVKAFCVDSKMCVSDVMHIVLPEIENISGTSNSGGGAAIQHTWLEVVLRVVAPKDSTINNCDLHGMNLPLKEALEDALGQPGIGHNSQWQLEFMAKLFLDQLKEIYGKAKVDEMWSSIIEADPYVTRESRIIQAEWALLENMANAPGEININD